MTVFKPQIQALWSIKSDVEEVLFALQDMDNDAANDAARVLEDVMDLLEDTLDNITVK